MRDDQGLVRGGRRRRKADAMLAALVVSASLLADARPARCQEADAVAATEEMPAGEPVMVDGGVSVAITADQRATIVGDAPSLRNVIAEICRQANIDLIAYAAMDHRFAGRLENVPLTDALRSMLRTESYLVGYSRDERTNRPRITWLRVMGGNSPAQPGTMPSGSTPLGVAPPTASQVTVSPPPDQRFSISSSLLFQAFGTFDPARRDMAQRELLERIAAPDELPKFLAMEPKELANMFGRYRDSAQTLRRLVSLSENGEVTQKLTEVIEMVGTPEEPNADNTP